MKLHSKMGMTLVELIVAVAFTAIIIAAACSVLYVGVHSFQSGTANAFSQQKAALAESYLQRYASTAGLVSSSGEEDTEGVFFSISENTLHISQQKISDGTKSQAAIASVDGISQIEVHIENGLLNYTIVSSDKTYQLSGGIALNNQPESSAAPFTVLGSTVLFLGKAES